MTITVDIKPEVEAELARQAALLGKPVEAYAATVLEEAVHLPSAHPVPVAKIWSSSSLRCAASI